MRVFQCDLCEVIYLNENNAASVRSGYQGITKPESLEYVHICPRCRKILGLATTREDNRRDAKQALINLLKNTRAMLISITH